MTADNAQYWMNRCSLVKQSLAYHKICRRAICIPCGRPCFLKLLLPQVIKSKLADEILLWYNPRTREDGQWILSSLAGLDSRLKVVKQNGRQYPNWIINDFYWSAAREDTMYIKLDDDIVWIEEGGIDRVFEFREAHPDYLLVSPLVINNGIGSYMLLDKLDISEDDRRNVVTEATVQNSGIQTCSWYKKPQLGVTAHRLLIDAVKNGRFEDLHCRDLELGSVRMSINAISWFGQDIRHLLPFKYDDEHFLTSVCTHALGLKNCMMGSTVFSHFAFRDQTDGIMASGVLKEYAKLARA